MAVNLRAVTIQNSVTSIGDSAFTTCNKLTAINYNGTKEQWNKIEKHENWLLSTPEFTIHCTDGDIIIPAIP